MSDYTPGSTVQFTVKATPSTMKARKTIERLMRMQPAVQRTLTKVAKDRARKNPQNRRGGRIWVSRIFATKVVNAERGARFSLRITPQILPDLKSVGRYLETA